MLRAAARRVGIPEGALRSDLPELFGIPSFIPPDPVKHWERVVRRSRRILRSLPLADGARVALVTPASKGDDNAGYTAVLAQALRLRGARPFVVYCDAWLDGCETPSVHFMTPEQFVDVGPRPMCAGCFEQGERVYRAAGLESHALSEFLDPSALATARRFADELPRSEYYRLRYRGMQLGEQVEATINRFYYVHSPHQEDWGERAETMWRVAHRMVRGTVMMADALFAMAERLRPDIFVVHYGSYLARGTAVAAARALGKRCLVWHRGYAVPQTIMLGEGENAFLEVAGRAHGPWEELRLDATRSRRVDELLGDRVTGTYRVMNPGAIEEESTIVSQLQLDPHRPVVALYTNVGYDTKLFYSTPVYPDVLTWIFDSIRLFAGRREQLVIRIHPGEVWLQVVDKDQTLKAIRREFPQLPENVRVIPADSKISSYALARLSQAAIVYGSFIGLELAARGMAVIVCGRGPYWQKGFTFDVQSREQYASYLTRLDEISAPAPARMEAARRFAYYFHQMRNVPFAHWNHDYHAALRVRPWWRLFRTLGDLAPGAEANLDALCAQILTGREAHAVRDGAGARPSEMVETVEAL